MYCTQCGTQNEEGARFCKQCGTPLASVDAGTATGNMEITPNVKNSFSKNKKILAMVGVCLIAVIGGLLFSNQKKQDTSYEVSLEQGLKYLKEEDFEKAESEFRKAIKSDEKQLESYRGLIDCYTKMEEPEKVEKIYEEVIVVIKNQYEHEKILLPGSEEMFYNACLYFEKMAEEKRALELAEEMLLMVEDEDVKEEFLQFQKGIGRYQAYWNLLQEYMDEYGEGEVETYPDLVVSEGVCFADLIDFANDGTEQLILAYGHLDEMDAMGTEYNVEVWDYIEGELVQVYSGLSSKNDTGECALILLVDNGITYINESCTGGLQYDYIMGYTSETFEMIESYEVEFGLEETIYIYNGSDVSEDEYDEELEKWDNCTVEMYMLFGADEYEYSDLEATQKKLNETITFLQEYASEGGNEEVAAVTNNEENYAEVMNAYVEFVESGYYDADGYYVTEETELYGVSEFDDYEGLRYSFYDIDDNGIEELIIGAEWEGSGTFIYDIWTYDGWTVDNLTLDMYLGMYDVCEVCENGIIRVNGEYGDGSCATFYYKISEDACDLEQIDAFSYMMFDGEYDGEREDEWRQMEEDYYYPVDLEWEEL